MALSLHSPPDEDEVLASINTTPLVDVMLVLLIIFLITIPVVTHTIPLSLPKETKRGQQTKTENITLSINKDGDIFWNQQHLAGTDALFQKLTVMAKLSPQPEVQIRGDERARYEFIGRVLFQCTRASIQKVSFIIEPPPKG